MGRRLRLLWVTAEPPLAWRSAAQERWRHLIRRFTPNHDVTLLTRTDGAGDAWQRDFDLTRLVTVPPPIAAPPDPLYMTPTPIRLVYTDGPLRARLAELLGSGDFDLVHYEYQEMMANAPAVPPIPTLLVVQQLEFLSDVPRGPLRRGLPRPWTLYRRMRNLDWELRALGKAHHVATMSAEDAARLRRFVPDLSTFVSPIGADCRELCPMTPAPDPDCDVLFLANFRHPPNADAARWLALDVVPRLPPGTRVRMVGREMPPELDALLRTAGVEVGGPVHETRHVLARAAVVVAPVRFGTGMRGKVLEALAMGRPLVTTSIGAEGLGARDGTHLLLGDDPAQFAAAVARLLRDPTFARRVGEAARSLAEERFDWNRIASDHERIYETILSRPTVLPTMPRDRTALLARIARRLPAPWGGVLGAAVLAQRGLRWYLRT